MNWENSAEWERDLELFEQSKRIADSLEKISNYLADRGKKQRVIVEGNVLSPQEEERLNRLDI